LAASITVITDALSLCGVTLPLNETEERAKQTAHDNLTIIKDLLATFPSIDSLFDLPECHDKSMKKIAKLYVLTQPLSAYYPSHICIIE
jgi:hypothetical protein